MRWFSISSSRKFTTRSGRRPSTAVCRPVLLLLASRSTARRRTPAARGLVERVGELRRAARGRRRACRAPRRPRTASGRRPGRSLPWPSSGAPRRARAKSSSRERLLDEPLLVVLVERLARDLLGREDRQVGDLVADLLDRAARLGLDVAPGLLHQLLALDPGLLERLALVDLAGLARAGDDLVGLRARLAQPLAVLGEQLVGLGPRALGGVDRLLDRVLALVERLGDARERALAQDEERDQERRSASRSSARRSG